MTQYPVIDLHFISKENLHSISFHQQQYSACECHAWLIEMQQVAWMLWRPCSSLHDCRQRQGNLPYRRERLSCGWQSRKYTHWRGKHVFMKFYTLVLLCHFCLLTGGELDTLPPPSSLPPQIATHFPSKCNSDSVVVGGQWKWTPQRLGLGNEIALTMALCHVAPRCILMISGMWRSTTLQDSYRAMSLIRLSTHSLSLSVIVLFRLFPVFPACFLISTNSLLL